MMKKSIPFLMGFILLLGLFTSCDNDDLEGLGKGANGSFSGDKLALTYSGVPMQGKQATFYTSDGKKATIRLAGLLDLSTLFPSAGIPSVAMMVPGVVPGEVETDLKNVPLTLSADGNSYTFEGTDQKNGRELTYKGEVSANKMVLSVQVKMPSTVWSGSWKASNKGVFFLEWDSKETIPVNGMELTISTIAPMAGQIVSQLLANSFQGVSFLDDGNVTITYKKKGMTDWATSPINLAHYYIKNEKLYLQLNFTQIMAAAQTTKATNITTLVKLLSSMVEYMAGGIPLQYEQNSDGTAKLWLATEDAKALLKLLTVDFIQEKIIAILPADIAPYVKPILENLSAILDSTTRLEMGLQLQRN